MARGGDKGNPTSTTTPGAMPSEVEHPLPIPSRSTPSRFTPHHRVAASAEEAEAEYLVARDAWTAAMRAAASGRAADLASLALAQETYETAAAERERWASASPTTRSAFGVDPAEASRAVEIVVGQELKWRRVKEHEPQKGMGQRIRRLFGR